MKFMKKICTAIFSCLFAVSLGLGIALNKGEPATAKAASATAVDVGFTYSAIVHNQDKTPTAYRFVLNNGIATPEAYDFYVYVNGQKTPAYTLALTGSEGCVFDIDYSKISCDSGESFLLEIPAGTYYQSNNYVAQDVELLVTHTGYNSEYNVVVLNRSEVSYISKKPYSVGLDLRTDQFISSNATALYFAIEDGETPIPNSGITGEDWSSEARYKEIGKAVYVNGVAMSGTQEIVKTGTNKKSYLPLTDVSEAGDVLTIDGWFKNNVTGALFSIEKTDFVFNGTSWETTDSVGCDVTESATAGNSAGFYFSTAEQNPIPSDEGWRNVTQPAGANNYALYNGVAKSSIWLTKLGADWYVQGVGTATANDEIILHGLYSCVEKATGITQYIYINPARFVFNGTSWDMTNPTFEVSVDGKAAQGEYIGVLPGQSVSDLTVTASNGGEVSVIYRNAVEDGKFVLRAGERVSEYTVTFCVEDDGVTYKKNMRVRVSADGFTMENGAALRVDGDKPNGLRFSAEMSEETYNSLKAAGATFGMVIIPRDYLTTSYELTVENLFGNGAVYLEENVTGAKKLMLHLENLVPSDRDQDGNLEIYGAITDLLVGNLTREFVGVAYACVNGEYILADYYEDNQENNTRSMYYVAQRAIEKGDKYANKVKEKYIEEFANYLAEKGKTYQRKYTVQYHLNAGASPEIRTEEITGVLNDVVTVYGETFAGYKLTSAPSVTQRLYANKANVFNFYYAEESAPIMDNTVWFYPTLNESNDFMNEENKAIVEKMKAAGFTTVNLGFNANMATESGIARTKKIIHMFWGYGGMRSVTLTQNSSDNENNSDNYTSLPDFKTCDVCGGTCKAFAGIVVWDEPKPTTAAMDRIAEYAVWYEEVYGADANYTFMVNLYPSYYDAWSDGDYTSYGAYLQAYYNEVLTGISGTRYLSVDTYPIEKNGTLMEEFLYDLAVLKAVAENTHDEKVVTNVILQLCGYGTSDHTVAPTKAQMRLQLYSALAFGMDSVSWWGYTTPGTVIIPEQTPAGNSDVYDAIKSVNQDLSAIGSIYKTYDWKGVIMSDAKYTYNWYLGTSTINSTQYNAYQKVKNETLVQPYILSATDTKSFVSITDTKAKNTDYVIGVMEDDNGNEAFTVVNYGDKNANDVTITFTAKDTDKNVYIYRNGVREAWTISASGTAITVKVGEGLFIVSADVKHTVTFMNDDGTVIYDTIVVENGGKAVYTGETPKKDGYAFKGWNVDLELPITKDVNVYAIFAKQYTVSFINADVAQQTLLEGETLSMPTTPTLDGYVFNGWTRNGEAYDFSTPVNQDITLVANWVKVNNNGEKSVILTAQQVSEQTVIDQTETYLGNDGIMTTESWYYDTDWPDYGLGGSTEKGKLLEYAVRYGTSAENHTHTLILPKINYTLYSKVDFGVINGGDSQISEMKLGGADVAYNKNRTISIVTDENGTRAIVYVAMANVSNNPAITIELSEAVATGAEGLTLSFKSTSGWTWVKVSQFHGTSRVCDYKVEMASILAQLPANAEELTFSEAENALVSKYLELADYMTAYERSVYEEPTVITVAKETLYYNAVVNAEAGSQAQIEAIATYREYSENLPDELKNSLNHKVIVAEVNKIIANSFYETETSLVSANDPVLSDGIKDDGDRIATGWGGQNTNYNTEYTQHVHMMQFNSYYSGTVTLPAFNYNDYVEVYFGMYMLLDAVSWSPKVDNNGELTIGNATYKLTQDIAPNFKVIIAGGILKIVDDSKDNKLSGATVLVTELSSEVLNGTAGLVLNFKFDAYAKVEITEMHGTALKLNEEAVDTKPTFSAGITSGGDRIVNGDSYNSDYNTEYTEHVYMAIFNGSSNDGTITLPAFNYNKYVEVYFGMYAISDMNSTITVAGKTISFTCAGNNYKVVIRNNVLAIYNDKKGGNNELLLTTVLSDNVANGTAPLVFDFTFECYSIVEITEMYACGYATQNNVKTSQLNKGESSNYAEANVGLIAESASQFKNEDKYETFSYATGATKNAKFVLNAFNYNAYSEVYFGVAFAATAEKGVVTINGETLEVPSGLIGHFYKMKAVVKDGYLTLIDDGSTDAVKNGATDYAENGYFFKVKLSESVLNGAESLVINFETGASSTYCWFEVTNTVAVVDITFLS